jgi:hypothetical protein
MRYKENKMPLISCRHKIEFLYLSALFIHISWHCCPVKYLSVKSHNFIERNHGGSEIEQGATGQIGLLITRKQFSEAVAPGMEAFDNPSARDKVRVAFRFGDFFTTRMNMRDMTARGNFDRLADMTRVKTKISPSLCRVRLVLLLHHFFQEGVELVVFGQHVLRNAPPDARNYLAHRRLLGKKAAAQFHSMFEQRPVLQD